MIEINNFKKFYGSHLALEIPHLRVAPGIHWVQGGNGSGKTTFFKTLAGLLPFQGEVLLASKLNLGKDYVACRKIINYGEADPLYPAAVTGDDLVQLLADSKQAEPAQVITLTTMLGVDAFCRRAVNTYSSGMLKKLSLVLAFIGQPKLILLDEPLITLDQATVKVVCKLIEEYHKKGVSFLVSSHQMFEDHELAFSSLLLVKNQTVTTQ